MEESYKYSQKENFFTYLKRGLVVVSLFTLFLAIDVGGELISQKVFGFPTFSVIGFITSKLGLADMIPDFSNKMIAFIMGLYLIELIVYIGIKQYEAFKKFKSRKNR